MGPGWDSFVPDKTESPKHSSELGNIYREMVAGLERKRRAEQRERRTFTLAETANLTSAAEDYMIGGGILTRGGKLLLYASSGLGKTTLMDHLTASLAAGTPFLGRFAVDRPYRVMFVQGELSEPELASHGQALLEHFGETPAIENLMFCLDTQLKLPSGQQELEDLVRSRNAEVVVLDPFICFFEGESTDKDIQVSQLTSTLDRLLEDETLGVQAVAVVHHSNVTKARTAGSYKFEAWPSTILRLEDAPGIKGSRYVKFEKIRAPGFEVPEKLRIELGDEGYLAVDGREDRLESAGLILLLDLLDEAGGQLTRAEIIERMRTRRKVTSRSVGNYLGEGRERGLLNRFSDGREAVYRLASVDRAAAAAAAN
jgi:predicted ATP-dependent serine protease